MSWGLLERELGSTPPPALADLPDDDLARLAELLADTRRRQAAALVEAADAGLRFLPRVLRGPVSRVLFR